MNRLFKFTATALSLLFLLLPLSSVHAGREILSDPGAKVTIERIAGQDRYETAILLSQSTFSKADTAVIASGETWPDALMGGQLAFYSKGPLLLATRNEVREDVLAELKHLGVTKLLLLGGDATLSAELESQLSKQFSVTRFSGKDRYETSRKIGEYIKSQFPLPPESPYIRWPMYVDGTNFADALAATPFVLTKGQVSGILYLNGGVYEPNAYKIGGDPFPDSFYHIGGADRYQTAAWLYGHGERRMTSTIWIVDGTDYPDGLAVGAVAQFSNGAILLTMPHSLPPATKELLILEVAERDIVDRVVIVGGTQSVGDEVIEEIRNLR